MSVVMMGLILFENFFRSQPPPAGQADQAVAAADASGQTDDEPANNGDEDEDDKLTANQPTEDSQSGETDSQAADSDLKPTDNEPAPTPKSEDSFVTLGSLGENSSDRYLITVNEKGGTIHRVELNFRDQRNGQFKYRDLEYDGGYLGCLDCIDTPAGCRVQTVGAGTPAALAKAANAEGGIQVGDILVSLDDEPIDSVKNFEQRLAHKTRPQQTVELQVKRGDKKLLFSVELTDKPIELLRPEKSRLVPQADRPESFVLSLIKPSEFVDQAWPDFDRNMRTANWELVNTDNPNQVVLKYEIPSDKLKAFELSGPFTVYKRYELPTVNEGESHELDSHSFHFNLEIEIVNGSDQPQSIAYELDGPTGTPSETWWYAIKIHGRSTAIGYTAGARDITGSSGRLPYVFWGGPEIVKGVTKTQPVVNYICDPTAENPADRELNYVGVDTQYFNVSLIPTMKDDQPFVCNSITAYTNGGEIPDNAREQKLVDCTFQMAKSVDLEPGGRYLQSFEIFCGPKEPEALDQYGLDDNRSFGWFAWCSKPLMWLLHFFYWVTGSFSYGLAIIMLTVLVRCLMIPISRKAALNAQMMQHLQPQMKEIADKYKDNMEKRASAQRELFKKHKYNPFGGCFMMFFQLPVFIGLYRGLSVDIALRDQPLIPGLDWCSNLSGPDQLLYWKDWMPGFLADETGWLGPFLNVLPIATMVLFIAQQKLFMPPAADEQQKMMQKMMSFMMIFMGIMFFKVSSGLCVYFITSSIWGIVERKMLPKPVLDTDKLSASVDGETTPANSKKMWREVESEKKKELKREEERLERKRQNAERKKRLKQRGR